MARQRRIVPWWIVIFVSIGLATLLLLGLGAYGGLSERLDRSRERLNLTTGQIEELAEGDRMLREQLAEEGIEPSAPPVTLEPVPPEEDIVITGERGPSCVEEIGLDACRGPQGIPGIGIQGIQGDQGIPGPSCGEEFGFEACRGDQGDDGIPGIDGQDGADGSDGAAGIDGIDGQDGADGVDGVDGQDGADGRGIASIEFVNGGDCHMVIIYTEGEPDEFPMPASMCKEPSEEP
jgi:hypothetical protein